MLRRSQFTIAMTVLFTAAFAAWTVMAFEDLDAINPLRPAAPSPLLTVSGWATHPVAVYAAVLLAGTWAWRRSFHSLAGATVLGMGGCAAAASSLGAGDKQDVRTVSSLCGWCAILVGAVLAVVLNLGCAPLLRMLGANAEILPHAAATLLA